MLCTGERLESIAHLLGLSRRTVEREIRAIMQVLKARSRAEAVLLMCGRGVSGGSPAATNLAEF